MTSRTLTGSVSNCFVCTAHVIASSWSRRRRQKASFTSKLESQSKPSEKVNIFTYFLDDREQVDLIGRKNLFSLRFMFNSGQKLDFFNWAGSKIAKHGK